MPAAADNYHRNATIVGREWPRPRRGGFWGCRDRDLLLGKSGVIVLPLRRKAPQGCDRSALGRRSLRSDAMSGYYALTAILLLLVVAAGFASVGFAGYEVVRLVGAMI